MNNCTSYHKRKILGKKVWISWVSALVTPTITGRGLFCITFDGYEDYKSQIILMMRLNNEFTIFNNKCITHEKFLNRKQYNPSANCWGEGSLGEVFTNYCAFRNRQITVGVSKMKPKSVRLMKEMKADGKISEYPNISCSANCYTISFLNDERHFGMPQYCKQNNHLQLLRQNGLSFAQQQDIIGQILSCPRFLHGHDTISCDLQSQNTLMINRKIGKTYNSTAMDVSSTKPEKTYETF